MLRFVIIIFVVFLSNASHAEFKAIDIYSQAQLTELIHAKKYFAKVKADDCQLVEDIEARAEVLKQPLYQFLWGEMLNHGVCVKANPLRGMQVLQDAVDQGSAEAMVKMAEYYYDGEFVIQDKNMAVHYVLPAAASANLAARLMLVKLFSQGYGSPRDYELAYHWLYNEVFSDAKTKKEAVNLLKVLATKMPPSAISRAKKAVYRIQ